MDGERAASLIDVYKYQRGNLASRISIFFHVDMQSIVGDYFWTIALSPKLSIFLFFSFSSDQ